MTTPNGRAPRHGAHFGAAPNTGASANQARSPRTPQSQPRAQRMRGQAPRSHAGATGAVGTRSALGSTGVSRRTAQATRRAGAGNVRKRPGNRRKSPVPMIAGGLVVLAAVLGLVFLVIVPHLTGSTGADDGRQQITAGQVVEVSVPDGSGATAIAQALYDAGVIESKSEFLTQVKRNGAESGLKSGYYEFVTGDSLDNIIQILCSGSNSAGNTLTIPEGYTVTRVASAVESTFGISADDFLAQAKASNYVADYPFLAAVNNDSLEGYLFPKTYSFTDKNVTADMVIRTMLSQWQTEMAGIDFDSVCAALAERYQISVTQEDVLTVASIVEREAANDDDRGKIASVFFNRLAIGMPLQSDATLAYWKGGEVTATDLAQEDNEWNTYTNKGLTPTPICSPGMASITAACNPDNTDYYYFYISGDYHVFSETYEQHQQAIDNKPQA